MVAATGFPAIVWQGLFPGATQTLTCTAAVKFDRVSVTDAYPLLFVTALGELSDPEPCMTAKFTVAPLFGTPRLTTRAVSGVLTDAPAAIQRNGVVTPISKDDDVAVSAVLAVRAGFYAEGERAAC